MTKAKKVDFTDLELLKKIQKMYKDAYLKRERKDGDFYIPIDCKEVAKELKVEDEMVFARLYYNLNKKYSYGQDDQSKVKFFALKVGCESKCINYPYLCAVVAQLKEEKHREDWKMWVAIGSAVIAALSLFFSYLQAQK